MSETNDCQSLGSLLSPLFTSDHPLYQQAVSFYVKTMKVQKSSNRLVIECADDAVLDAELLKAFTHTIEEYFNFAYTVDFEFPASVEDIAPPVEVPTEAKVVEAMPTEAMPAEPAAEAAPTEATTEATPLPQKKKLKNNKVLVGNPIKDEPIPLAQCNKEKRNVVARGFATNISTHDIKDGKTILSFTLTNYKDALTVKAFLMKETYNDSVKKYLQDGASLCCKGRLQLDSFSHDITLGASSIVLLAEELKLDEDAKAEWDSMIVGKPINANDYSIADILTAYKSVATLVVDGDASAGLESRLADLGRFATNAVIMGEPEFKDLKSRASMTAQLYDYTGAISMHVFMSPETRIEYEEIFKKGPCVHVMGQLVTDFQGEPCLECDSLTMSSVKISKPKRKDTSEEKRIELHAHTQSSEKDGLCKTKELVQQAYDWGHAAIAITDHGVVQSFPDAMSTLDDIRKKAEKKGETARPFKIVYGVEAYLVDDLKKAVTDLGEYTNSLHGRFVVFDIETTGFNKEKDQIIEIGAVRVEGGKVTEHFSRFVDPLMPIPERITALTSITDADVKGQGSIAMVLPDFLDFVGEDLLVAHNAEFDMGFIRAKSEMLAEEGTLDQAVAEGIKTRPFVDTLAICRGLFELNKYTLDRVCKHLGISLENHHRAVDDAGACAEIFAICVQHLAQGGVDRVDQIDTYLSGKIDVKHLKAYHAIILVKNLVGLRNLYELVSESHLEHYNRYPRLPKSSLLKKRDGLLVGSACVLGELFQAVLHDEGAQTIDRLANFYDYFEVQPLGNNAFLIEDQDELTVTKTEDLENLNKRIIALGKQYNKPVVATGDVHFMEPSDEIYRRIIMKFQGFKDADPQPPLYLHTTEEMMNEFYYVDEATRRELVIDNPAKIVDMVEEIRPIPKGKFPPEIPGALEELTDAVYGKAHAMYGDPLPAPVEERLTKEMNAITTYGYATLYLLARRLVLHSRADGYYVGSRGSVGSSFVATMADITEVNPLPPHYYCPKCQYSDFDSPTVKAASGESGFDLPDAVCPCCGTKLKKDGHEIPFEVFLGFKGDKEPDIDLNFSGEYQPRAHAYVEEMFGKDQVFRAGTMSGIADKTAIGYVRKFEESEHRHYTIAERAALASGISGVKTTTGQHPGGQIVVPKGHTIYEFCPVQYPANDPKVGTITTHYDYNKLHETLLKLDILGHDDPTMVRMLEELTDFKATEAPLDDPEVMSLFLNTKALGVTPEDIGSPVGTFGIPEFGTTFVRGMLLETKPQTFADLVRISGLSHGTNVWNNNARDIVVGLGHEMKECICTREDIMTGLIHRGLDNSNSFRLMEVVRKGKKSGGLKPDDIAMMHQYGVEDWYIESCKKIQYLFPKAHAAAYVTMSLRVAYYKVHFKEAYYASYFTIRAEDAFDYEKMCLGLEHARAAIRAIEDMDSKEKTAKDERTMTILQMIVEFYCRGLEFLPISLQESDATKFKIVDGKLLPPFSSLAGLGGTAAESIVEARQAAPFRTVEELKQRTKLSQTLLDTMKRLGILGDLPECDQMTLF